MSSADLLRLQPIRNNSSEMVEKRAHSTNTNKPLDTGFPSYMNFKTVENMNGAD